VGINVKILDVSDKLDPATEVIVLTMPAEEVILTQLNLLIFKLSSDFKMNI